MMAELASWIFGGLQITGVWFMGYWAVRLGIRHEQERAKK